MTIQGHPSGIPGEQTSRHAGSDVEVYRTLSKSLVFENENEQIWWEKTAPLLERIMVSAEYTLLQRSQFLTLYRTLMVPKFGPYPHTWHASITHSGIPMEFSVNYQSNGQSTVRIGFEPVTDISGTHRDPYNLITVSDAINQISRFSFDGFDPYLFTSFLTSMTLTKEESNMLGGAKLPGSKFKTQVALGLDLKGEDVTVKCYVYPALKIHASRTSFYRLLADTVQKLSDVMECGDGVTMVNEYMEKAGCYNQYSFLGFDCISPSKSRLKIYGALLDITWQKTEEIWTLGGQLSSSETNKKGLELMRILWDYLAPGKDRRTVGIWNYELLPGSVEPVPKFYFDMHGENDLQNAEAVLKFFNHLGWSAKAASLLDNLQKYFPNANMAETTELIQYVSFSMTTKGPYVSVYYHSSY